MAFGRGVGCLGSGLTKWVRWVRVAWAAAALLGLSLPAAAAMFALPGASDLAVWEAEEAAREGTWEVSREGAKGARYVEPAGSRGEWALDFPFEVEEATTLRVRPVWWRNGEQKPARRFPYPLVRQPGPDVVDRVGTMVFCTAPAAGRVVVVDGESEKVAGFVEVGGYLTDLVADEDAGMVYVADGLGDRVVVIDAGARAVVREIPVAGSPWSLALDGGRLYVACRDGKQVVALDAATGEEKGGVGFAAAPISLELVGEEQKRLIVRFQEQAFDVLTLETLDADEEQFAGDDGSGKPRAGCGGPTCECKWMEAAGPHQIAIVSNAGREVVDVGAVTRGPASRDLPAELQGNPGPASAVVLRAGDPEELYAFFAAPSRGLIGVYNMDKGALAEPIPVGGYPIGIAIDRAEDRLYVADAARDRVIVVDPAARKVERELAVPGAPCATAFVREVAWQRTELVPATEVNRLFVACRESRDVAVVSLESGAVVGRVPMPAEPRSVRFVPLANPDWWPVLADDRIPFALTPRAAVELVPVTLNAETLARAEDQVDVPRDAPLRRELNVAVGDAAKAFTAGNELVLGVGGERWIDLSAAADPQRVAPRPLTGKERPGTISVSIDGGPEMDWASGVWVAPESKMFLVSGSEEFWQHNAPSFGVGPGRHVLRVRASSEFARLDAVAVRRALGPEVSVEVFPEPRAVHGRVPNPTYQGVFYDQEPVQFTLRVSNEQDSRLRLRFSYVFRNYMGEVVHATEPSELWVGAGASADKAMAFEPRETGRFTLTVECVPLDSPMGSVVKEARFLRLPKLEHPRLFWRADEEEAIRARIAAYPELFRRYGEWVERMAGQEGRFPERFLPPEPTAEKCAACAPEEITDPGEAGQRYGWRNYEVGWRILAVQFAERFLKPGSAPLEAKIEELRAAEKADTYIAYHHHGPFFPGAVASLVDLAPGDARASMKLTEFLEDEVGDMNTPPWTLVMLEEPLTPEKRGLIYEIMTWENNAERYFETHQGRRGGTWWLNPYTWCHCPMHGYTISFALLRNFFGEPRLFEKPIFSGYLTFHHYADPIRDTRELQPKVGNPGGEPWRWIFSSLARHPLEKAHYDWEGWVEQMAGPIAGDERTAVDELMALEGRPLTGEMTGHANHFVSGVSVPIALALGWYDPSAAEVEMEELPPTAVFEVEGWAAMRSGWGEDATEVTLVSGVRDHTTRHKPNHLTIVKGGEYLLGTPATYTDDGNNTGAWGNTVVVGDGWVEGRRLNLEQPRDGEHLVINRFSPAGLTYLGRDLRLVGYRAAESGWGGGLNLHGHTETLFMDEGRLLAYRTWPELDYAAGDASNAWPCEEVREAVRQVVFVKPDVVVVYDRVELGPGADASRWIAATGSELRIDGPAFRIGSGSEFLHGRVVLPERAVVSNAEVLEPGWQWEEQKLLEVRPAAQGKTAEYVVVMKVGGDDRPLPAPTVAEDEGEVRVRLALEKRLVEVRFDRGAECGGEASVVEGTGTRRYELRPGIVDSYRDWQADPRYERWVGEPRFGFVMPEG